MEKSRELNLQDVLASLERILAGGTEARPETPCELVPNDADTIREAILALPPGVSIRINADFVMEDLIPFVKQHGQPVEPQEHAVKETDGTWGKLNRWFYEQKWRKLFSWDKGEANLVRQTLANLGLYPARDIDHDPGLATAGANYRAALHQIVDELGRTDLQAVFSMARLLVLVERDPGFWAHVGSYDQKR